jgi:hypothetical protein
VGEAAIAYLEKHLTELNSDDASIAFKTLSDIPSLKSSLQEGILSWEAVEQYFIVAIKENNKMLLLFNLSFLDQYLSPKFLTYLAERTVKRMRNESKMKFYQSRWVSINLTALARLYSAPNLDSESREKLQSFSHEYALIILNKLHIPDN